MAVTMPVTWPDGSPVAQDRLIIMVATDDFSVQVSEVFNYLLPGPVSPTATPVPQPPTQPTPQASLNLAPTAGVAGARVNAVGSGFPPAAPIALYLAAFDGEGEGDGRSEQYATGVTDVNGNYALTFEVPERWPNGERIDSGRIVVLVATNDFTSQATALFAYTRVAAAGGESAEPTATATSIPPTDTPIPPTATATEAATNTPIPPTATETPVPAAPTATAEPAEEPPAESEIPPPAAPITSTNPLTETDALP